jgi:formamidopyrimidine-DNA glycosylase
MAGDCLSLRPRRLTAALDQQLAKHSNGQRVVDASSALKYLLAQICETWTNCSKK